LQAASRDPLLFPLSVAQQIRRLIRFDASFPLSQWFFEMLWLGGLTSFMGFSARGGPFAAPFVQTLHSSRLAVDWDAALPDPLLLLWRSTHSADFFLRCDIPIFLFVG